MAVFIARTSVLGLRCSAKRLNPRPAAPAWLKAVRAGIRQPGSAVIQVPVVGLLCWASREVRCATCQELLPTQRGQERRSLAKVRVHGAVLAARVAWRALVLVLKFGPLFLLYPLCLPSRRLRDAWLDALLWVTETSGPTFIKLGQWASTRRDIFSPEFCDRFCRLHVRVRPHPWGHTKQVLRRAFGDGWRRLFLFQSREPVGSGCVAQVYRAMARVDCVEDPAFRQRLDELERQDLLEAWEIPGLGGVLASLWGRGQAVEDVDRTRDEEADTVRDRQGPCQLQESEHLIPVAIKVLHPGVKRQVQVDLLLMRAASQLLTWVPGLKWLSLPEIVEEFEKLMTRQIDLRYEAQNFERFQVNFQNVDFVKFPTPLRPFVTRDILVETYEESEPISAFLSDDIPDELKRRIARMGVDTLLKMVFVDNFVHGDLHPGNILVQGGHDSACPDTATLTDLCDTVVVSMRPGVLPARLVLLDAGITARLSEEDLRNFRAVFAAVALHQGERVAELILKHARASECADVPGFKKDVAQLVNEALSNPLSLGKVQVGDLLSRVFKLLIAHKVKLESNFASIVFAILVLEGLGRSLDPNLDILEMAKPLLLKSSASLL
ncbi:putative aarF domain-containing protein kinase 2 [Arapaima gigas]